MEQALRALLIAALSGLSSGRINWGEHPQDEANPYVVLHLISMVGGHTMQGPDGLIRYRVQVDCYAPDFGAARTLGAEVTTILDFHRAGGFRGILFDGMRMSREGGENDGERLYRASMDFLINWRDDHA